MEYRVHNPSTADGLTGTIAKNIAKNKKKLKQTNKKKQNWKLINILTGMSFKKDLEFFFNFYFDIWTVIMLK